MIEDLYLPAPGTHDTATGALREAVREMPESRESIRQAARILDGIRQQLQRMEGHSRGGFLFDNLTAADILDALEGRR